MDVEIQRYTKNFDEKVESLTEFVFDLCAAGIHKKHQKNTFRAVSNQIYDSKAFAYTGLISVRAKKALDSGEITRKDLCHEHFITRSKTTYDLFSHFDSSYGKHPNSHVIEGLKDIVISGCRVNMVLSEENYELAKHQKDKTLPPEEAYINAGVKLVPDIRNNK